MKTYKAITEERYYEMLEVLPPIYVRSVDGIEVDRGFSVAEATRHANDGRSAFTTCFMKDGLYYECEAVLSTDEGKAVKGSGYEYEYSRGNKAQSIN